MQSADAAAGVLYVDKNNPSCSDTAADAGSQAKPYCSIGLAAKVADKGQTVQVASGSYAELVTVGKPGDPGSPVVYQAALGATVTVGSGMANGFKVSNKSNVTIQGFAVSGTTSYGIYVTSGSSNVAISGNSVDHTKGVGVYVSGGANHTVSGNHVSYAGVVSGNSSSYTPGIKLAGVTGGSVSGNTADHNSDAGIQLASGTTGVTVSGNEAFANARSLISPGKRAAPGIDLRGAGNSVVGNYSHDNEDTGVQLYSGGDNNTVANNVLVGGGDHGVDVSHVRNARIVENTVYNNCASGINVEGSEASGNAVWDNVAVDNGNNSRNGVVCYRGTDNTPGKPGNIAISDNARGTTTVDHNNTYQRGGGTQYYWGARNTLAQFRTASGGQAMHDVYGDPRWVDAGGGDFHLTASSPAVGLADPSAPGYLPYDLDGAARDSAPDAGAYEYAGGGPPPTTTTSSSTTTTVAPTTTTVAPRPRPSRRRPLPARRRRPPPRRSPRPRPRSGVGTWSAIPASKRA